ncbi:unnamed protein product [Taenia asiatica]|uniref:Stathmin domain-containing protein 1 n=1 Tax=Taenia asiatica TaxID=60517 RepID=A0A0R3W1R7_TAEAS|nr:unnamed protein product [Taenia asiatica]
MGCSPSAPEAVVNDIAVLHNQKAAGDVVVDGVIVKNAEPVPLPPVVGDEDEKEVTTKSEASKLEKVIKVEETPANEAASKTVTQNPLQRCDSFGGADGIIAKKGYVVFEINLDGELDTCLDSSKKPLPKRLKRLEPLPRAPKLTAEELNEKLERAEQKHLKALAMRKSGISRRFEKFVKQPPGHKGDAPTAVDGNAQRSDDAGENTDVGTSQEVKAGLEAPENTPKPEENDQTTESEQVSNYDVVDLNNNNAREWAGNPMDPSSSAEVIAGRSHGHHTLNAVKEVDEENTE